MRYDLKKLEELGERGYISKTESGDFVLFNYTNACVYAKFWTPETRACRGLILRKDTGEVVAKPMNKFFNILEHEETFISNLPKDPYVVTEKVDGSLGILYLDERNGWSENLEYRLATRGSFESPQAIEGTKILHEKYPKITYDNLDPCLTLCFEIIYPQNRVSPGARLVCNYGDTRQLVLLGGYDRLHEEELSRTALEKMAKYYDLTLVKEYIHTIAEMLELQKTLPSTQEGFVVHYPKTGLRVKIKGAEYLRMNKILNSFSPLSVFEVMRGGEVPQEYLISTPEEILPEIKEYADKLTTQYKTMAKEIGDEVTSILERIGGYDNTPEAKKRLGLYLQKSGDRIDHRSAIFAAVLKKEEMMERHIMEAIRPVSNKFRKI